MSHNPLVYSAFVLVQLGFYPGPVTLYLSVSAVEPAVEPAVSVGVGIGHALLSLIAETSDQTANPVGIPKQIIARR